MAILTDTITERTSGAGVTIDGLLIKDGGLPDVPGAGVTEAQATALSAYQSALAAADAGQVLTSSGAGAAGFATAKPSLSDYQNVIVVDSADNGDYTTLAAALAAVSGASATNRFGIVVFPGVYFIASKQSLLKNGVDIFAAIPGSVIFMPSAPSYTDGMFAIGDNEAMDSLSTITGIMLYQDSLNYGNAPALLFADGAYRFQAKFVNCVLRGDGAMYPITGSTSVVSTSVLEFDNCIIHQTDLSATVAAIRIRSQYALRLRNTRLAVSNSGANTTPMRIDTVASGANVLIKHGEMIGGGYGLIAAQAATTFPVIYTSFSVAPNANFANSISTPYNIIDANLANF